MTITQLNNYIGKISTTLPIVNSFYTNTTYECWNTNEVRYGSVVFVVTNIRSNGAASLWDCTLYYGDRLTEGRTNLAAVQSDGVNVLQSIIGAVKQSDGIMDVVEPYQITLFEQDFADCLGGAYVNLSIKTVGFSECGFEGVELPDFPDYVNGHSTLDDYYTKEQIDQFNFANERLVEDMGNNLLLYLDGHLGDLDAVLDAIMNEPELVEIQERLNTVLYG